LQISSINVDVESSDAITAYTYVFTVVCGIRKEDSDDSLLVIVVKIRRAMVSLKPFPI